eukprot:gene42237-57183_t
MPSPVRDLSASCCAAQKLLLDASIFWMMLSLRCLIVTKLDRLGRNAMDVRQTVESLAAQGVRVLTIEHYGAGPYATLLMSELGAEVIKIEAPSMGGDASRPTGPFLLGENDSQYFQTFSRGKKSAAIELKTPEGRADFERLVRSAEAVVNNLRGDQPVKLGLTFDALKAVNPAIVRPSFTGIDLDLLIDAGAYISGFLDRKPNSRAANALLTVAGARAA